MNDELSTWWNGTEVTVRVIINNRPAEFVWLSKREALDLAAALTLAARGVVIG